MYKIQSEPLKSINQQLGAFVTTPPMIENRLPIVRSSTSALAVGLAILLAGSILSEMAGAQTPEEIGLQIATDARERDRGFGNFTGTQQMTLRNKQGQESKRELRIKVLEVDGEGNQTLFIFDNPKDVSGTAFLTHSYRDKADDQWIYLPALKRVKRISSSNRSGSFMGSEFAYEDLTPQEVEKFTYKFIGEEPCGDLTCTVVEQVPTDRKSGYRRQLFYRDKDEFRVFKVEYFDRKGTHLKTLDVTDYELYLDKFWRASTMDMVNHITGKRTTLTWLDYQFGTELDENDFTKTGLKRVR